MKKIESIFENAYSIRIGVSDIFSGSCVLYVLGKCIIVGRMCISFLLEQKKYIFVMMGSAFITYILFYLLI